MSVGGAMTNVKTRLSEMAAVQTILGAGDASEALTRIFKWAAPPFATLLPPRIVLDPMSVNGTRKGQRMQGDVNIEVLTQITIPTANTTTEEAQWEWFGDNVMDPMLAAISADVGADGGLDLLRWNTTLAPTVIVQSDLPTKAADSVVWVWQQQMTLMAL